MTCPTRAATTTFPLATAGETSPARRLRISRVSCRWRDRARRRGRRWSRRVRGRVERELTVLRRVFQSSFLRCRSSVVTWMSKDLLDDDENDPARERAAGSIVAVAISVVSNQRLGEGGPDGHQMEPPDRMVEAPRVFTAGNLTNSISRGGCDDRRTIVGQKCRKALYCGRSRLPEITATMFTTDVVASAHSAGCRKPAVRWC